MFYVPAKRWGCAYAQIRVKHRPKLQTVRSMSCRIARCGVKIKEAVSHTTTGDADQDQGHREGGSVSAQWTSHETYAMR